MHLGLLAFFFAFFPAVVAGIVSGIVMFVVSFMPLAFTRMDVLSEVQPGEFVNDAMIEARVVKKAPLRSRFALMSMIIMIATMAIVYFVAVIILY